MNLSTILKDSIHFFRYNLRQITFVCLPMLAAVAFLGQLIHVSVPDGAPFLHKAGLPLLPGLIAYPIYTGALILLMNDQAKGKFPGNAELIRRAMSIWPPLFALHLLITLLIMMGLFMFVLPGIWLMVRLSFAEILVVVRGQAPLDALKDSFIRTGPYFWMILQCILLVIVPIWGLDYLVGRLVPSGIGTIVPNALFSTGIAFAALLVDIAMFRIFMGASTTGHNTE